MVITDDACSKQEPHCTLDWTTDVLEFRTPSNRGPDRVTFDSLLFFFNANANQTHCHTCDFARYTISSLTFSLACYDWRKCYISTHLLRLAGRDSTQRQPAATIETGGYVKLSSPGRTATGPGTSTPRTTNTSTLTGRSELELGQIFAPL